MTYDDLETMLELVNVANAQFDGHLTVMKFTTNWRVGFITPEDRERIEAMHVGSTFDEAAGKALHSGRLSEGG